MDIVISTFSQRKNKGRVLHWAFMQGNHVLEPSSGQICNFCQSPNHKTRCCLILSIYSHFSSTPYSFSSFSSLLFSPSSCRSVSSSAWTEMYFLALLLLILRPWLLLPLLSSHLLQVCWPPTQACSIQRTWCCWYSSSCSQNPSPLQPSWTDLKHNKSLKRKTWKLCDQGDQIGW